MNIPNAWIYFPATDTRIQFTVRDLWIDFEGGHDSIEIKPFERADQALQRVYPGCEVYMQWADDREPLFVNSPGNREWLV